MKLFLGMQKDDVVKNLYSLPMEEINAHFGHLRNIIRKDGVCVRPKFSCDDCIINIHEHPFYCTEERALQAD